MRRIVSSARAASSFAVSENCCSCDEPSAMTGFGSPLSLRSTSGLVSSSLTRRMLARLVTRLRSTTARVLVRTGALGEMPIDTSTVPGRFVEKAKPVTAPTRMPFMRTSLRTSRPSSDCLAK